MQWFHNLIGRHDDDAAAVQQLAITFPVIAEAGKGEYVTVPHADVVRNLVAVDQLPFIKFVSRDQATPMLE